MQIVSTFPELAEALQGRRSCLTIGVFDGVHLGHQALITRTINTARQHGDVAVAVTFRNHPLSILAPPYNPRCLITPARKANLLEQMGVDILLMMEFSKEFASIAPEQFISKLLVKEAAIHNLVCGYDFTFGFRGAGDVETLRKAGVNFGFNVESVGAVSYANNAVKSTHIRDLLSSGHVADVARLMTRPHELPGIVGSGMQRGRTIGFPTANLQIRENFQTPGGGVYLCAARVGMQPTVLPAMVNIGTNPTFGNNAVSVEAHILEFDQDIHGQALSLFFMDRLRDEQKFSSVNALVEQLNKDRDLTQSLWKSAEICNLAAMVPAAIVQS